jgi:hypothetical protein
VTAGVRRGIGLDFERLIAIMGRLEATIDGEQEETKACQEAMKVCPFLVS